MKSDKASNDSTSTHVQTRHRNVEIQMIYPEFQGPLLDRTCETSPSWPSFFSFYLLPGQKVKPDNPLFNFALDNIKVHGPI